MLRIAASPSAPEQLVVPDGDELAAMQEEFELRHCVMIPRLVDRDLAEEIAGRIDHAHFFHREHDGVGVEDCMEVNTTLAWLLLLVNDRRLLDVVRSITGCGPIGHFDGRVYRLEPSTDHHDSWHDDIGEGRLVAMSINLGRKQYVGGALEIRERQSGVITEARAPDLGDALLFRLGNGLEHRVRPVTGESPRTVFAGWHKSGESFLATLRKSEQTGVRAAVSIGMD